MWSGWQDVSGADKTRRQDVDYKNILGEAGFANVLLLYVRKYKGGVEWDFCCGKIHEIVSESMNRGGEFAALLKHKKAR